MPQLTAKTRPKFGWPLLAIALSTSTLTLALCQKPEPPRATLALSDTHEAGPAGPDLAEPAPASHSNRPSDDPDETLSALFASAQREEPALRRAALERIAEIGGDRAREFLARRFDAASDSELPDLAAALASLGDPQARALLRAGARSLRPAARSAAFDALSTLDSADVREFMVSALDFVDPSPAASYFSGCREPRALPGLERAVRNGDADQRGVAVAALFAQGASAESAILRLLLEDDELCDALLETQALTPTARRTLRRASIARLRAGAVTSGPLFEFLQHDLSDEARAALVQAAHDPGSRDSALAALAARGDSDSLRALSTLSNDGERGLAERAACALLAQPDSRWRPFLSDGMRRSRVRLPNETAAALQRINLPGGRAI